MMVREYTNHGHGDTNHGEKALNDEGLLKIC